MDSRTRAKYRRRYKREEGRCGILLWGGSVEFELLAGELLLGRSVSRQTDSAVGTTTQCTLRRLFTYRGMYMRERGYM